MEKGILTKSSEDYLEAIYELSTINNNVKSVDIANKLDVTKASVNKALSTLRSAGLIEQEKYGRVTLTEEGAEYGESILQRHHMLKRFLVELLQVDEEQAEYEACEMEHAISLDTAHKWVKYMKHCLECRSMQEDLSQKLASQ